MDPVHKSGQTNSSPPLLPLAAQREEKQQKAKASSYSSFSGFYPLTLSSSFDLAVISTVAASVDSYKVMDAASTLIVSASLCSSTLSTSAEPPRKRKRESILVSSGFSKARNVVSS